MKQDRPVNYTEVEILEAKLNLIRAAIRVRLSQIKQYTNHGTAYYSKKTLWLRERLDTLNLREQAIDNQIEEMVNGN